jgi:arsenite/tail-anchored protein-transporting ATPase
MRRPLPLARRTGDLGWGGGDRSIFPDGERIASDQGRSSRAGWLLSDACRYGFILRARDGMLRMTAGPPNSPWRFLDHPPAFLFFTGKGGVGKTSLACATALALAEQGRATLLVSTDPASNVGQVLNVAIGHQITPIAAVPGLSALEIDPQAAARAYRDRIVGPVRGVLPDTVVQGIEEQLSGACTTEIAAFDEFTALLTDATLIEHYDHIVFDTAPTGHTIRLLQLPGAWTGFLETGKGDASCLGPLAGLEKQRSRYQAAVAALADPRQTRLILVARAQASTLREVARTREELAAIGLGQQYLALNGLLPEAEAAHDALAAALWRREQAALAAMPESLRALPTDLIALKPFNLVGIDALRGLLGDAAVEVETTATGARIAALPSLAELIDELADDRHGLILLMGKGGVGKTTLAAALAVELADRGYPVHLTTSDPAAHLVETLDGAREGLTVSRIDPRAETERYRQQVLASKGRGLDESGRALLEEDLRSPCTEEIAVFQAFSRLIREAGRKFVVMDTAPTGHTLLLLDATGAYHREIARQIGDSGLHFTTPLMQLQDPKQTKVLIVTLPETTPVLEAARLQDDLRRAGIEPWAWVINNSLAIAATAAPLLRRRAARERSEIDAVRHQHARRVAQVPLCAEEPVGVERLQALLAVSHGHGV